MKRRELIYTLAGTTLAAGAIGKVMAGDDTTAKEEATEQEVDFLFVQYAESVKLADGKLTLMNVSKDLLYFSDRPDRIVGRESMDTWMDFWAEGEESFAVIPPNAVLAIANPQGGAPLDMVVILKNPDYRENDLTYEVEILEGPDSGKGGACALFIDAVGIPGVGPTSIRGQTRRVARRTARRTSRRMIRRANYRENLYGSNSVANDYYNRGYMDAQNDYYDEQAAYQEGYREGYDDGRKDFY